MLQTAEGALGEVTNILVRMKDLATQAADASSTAADQTAMQSEYTALNAEIANILDNTTFGGAKLLRAGAGTGTLEGAMNFQIGATTAEKMTVTLTTEMGTLNTDVLAANTATLTAGANAAIDTIATAIASVGAVSSAIGAAANRLEHVHNNLSNISTNTQAATGRIMDVDFASESANMTSSQMLLQAGTAMLKQSNSMSSMVMSLLQ
jgi:flagellin